MTLSKVFTTLKHDPQGWLTGKEQEELSHKHKIMHLQRESPRSNLVTATVTGHQCLNRIGGISNTALPDTICYEKGVRERLPQIDMHALLFVEDTRPEWSENLHQLIFEIELLLLWFIRSNAFVASGKHEKPGEPSCI